MPDPTIESYDRIAEEYGRTNAISMWGSQLQEFKRLILGGRILEIGCGRGRDAVSFIKEGYGYVGVDASQQMIRMARERLPHADFRLMDFYDLQFRPRSFDGFLAIASLLHIPKNKVGNVLESIGDLIEPEGVGLVTMRKGEGEGWREKNGSRRYFAFYSADEFRQKLENAHYSVVNSGETEEPDGTKWLYFFTRREI